MKIHMRDLRKIIKEELLRGIPEFVIRQASEDCVNRIKQHIKRFVQTKAQNPTHARELLMISQRITDEMEDEIFKLVQDKLWQFIQQT